MDFENYVLKSEYFFVQQKLMKLIFATEKILSEKNIIFKVLKQTYF
jgi:hypothetical protein